MTHTYLKKVSALTVAAALTVSSCIEPPLHLPAEEVIIDIPIVVTDMQVVWDVDVDMETDWHYGWDETDVALAGELAYPEPTNFEVRRYYIGEAPGGKHTAAGMDGFTIFSHSFRRSYEFGYYDLLLWSNIDSPEGTQVLLVDESDIDEVRATTTATRGFIRGTAEDHITGLYNQPEIFYSTYEQDIHISQNFDDYDYYDEEEGVWIKKVDTKLTPLVYIYMVQIILHNNDGRITGITGDAAISAMASGTSVNTGHTNNRPCMVYFPMRLKQGLSYKGEKVDIIGGKLTTFGLCDMPSYREYTKAPYNGSRTDLANRLYFTLRFKNGTEQTYDVLITDQCQAQSHGGVLTYHIDVLNIEPPKPDDPPGGGSGNLFVPTVDDYEHVDYEIPM